MKQTIVGLILLLLFSGWHYYIYFVRVPGMPEQVVKLDSELRQEQEKLISAQILNSNLDRVASLINRNLATSLHDSLASDASVPFMNEVIELTNRLGIEMLGLEAGKRKKDKSFVRTPYQLSIKTDYGRFGRLVTTLEKSNRLVTLNGFRIRNDINTLNRARTFDELQKHEFIIYLQTLTLIKSKPKA
jgi:Tfp pilus assembly protein PilO